MAGIIGIYGLVVSVLISDNLSQQLSLFTSFIQLGAGLSVGLAGLAAGFAIGIVGDAGVRGTAQQPRLFVGMVRIDKNVFSKIPVELTDADSHSHFRRSLGSVRTHRRSAHELKGFDRCSLLSGSKSTGEDSSGGVYQELDYQINAATAESDPDDRQCAEKPETLEHSTIQVQ